MYFSGASQCAIAREFHCSQTAVWIKIRKLGLSRPERRGPPAARTCWCGEAVWKRRGKGFDAEGDPHLSGTRCLKHQREYERQKQERSRIKFRLAS